MFRVLAATAWLWGYVLARYIIWSHEWRGILWYPNPNASSWYALTDLKFKPKPKHLPYIFFLSNILMLIFLLTCPESIPVFSAILIVHIVSALWWPAFIELKFTWKNCFILAAFAHGATIFLIYWFFKKFYINFYIIFPVFLMTVQTWMVFISGYAYKIVKQPTLLLQYQRRESRNLLEV